MLSFSSNAQINVDICILSSNSRIIFSPRTHSRPDASQITRIHQSIYPFPPHGNATQLFLCLPVSSVCLSTCQLVCIFTYMTMFQSMSAYLYLRLSVYISKVRLYNTISSPRHTQDPLTFGMVYKCFRPLTLILNELFTSFPFPCPHFHITFTHSGLKYCY